MKKYQSFTTPGISSVSTSCLGWRAGRCIVTELEPSCQTPLLSRSGHQKVIHTPKALKPCSLGVRVITVSSTSISATKQSGADVHHTASFHAIRSPAHANSSFHGSCTHRSSTGDKGHEPAVVGKKQQPRVFAIHGQLPLLCLALFHKTL